MKNLIVFGIAVCLVIGITFSASPAQAGWMATADYTSCPSNVQATYRSEGPFNTESDCLARIRQVAASQVMFCAKLSCTSQGGGSGSSGSAQPGHEMDKHIGDAIAGGLTGDISATDTVGLVGMGLIGNALLSPGTPKSPQQIEAERAAALRAAIEAERLEREREQRRDARAQPMFALLDPVPDEPPPEATPARSSFFTKGFEHASQCISQNAGTSCSVANAAEQTTCIEDYRAGYSAGSIQRKLAMEEAFQAGLVAGTNGMLANGNSDARSDGPCRIEWVESYNRGHFQGKNRKSGL